MLEPALDCLRQLLELVQQPDMGELRAILLSTELSTEASGVQDGLLLPRFEHYSDKVMCSLTHHVTAATVRKLLELGSSLSRHIAWSLIVDNELMDIRYTVMNPVRLGGTIESRTGAGCQKWSRAKC